MRLIPLGFGGWVSSPWAGPSSILLDLGRTKILLDAGEGVYRALRHCGFDIDSLSMVLISHMHGDHFMGITTIALFASRVGKRIVVYGPRDLDVRGLFKVLGIPQYLDAVDFHPVDATNEPRIIYSSDDLRIMTISVNHTVPALAYRVDSGRFCVTYSGDTGPSDNLITLARGCHVLIHEVSGNPGFESVSHAHGHSTTVDAINAALKAGVKYLVPTHYYVESPILLKPEVNIVIPLQCTPVDLDALMRV